MQIEFPSAQSMVAILAGGMGTRLKDRAGNLPKPMVPVLGRPLLEHQIELCREHGFTRISLLVHYNHEAISDHFGTGSGLGVELDYILESSPRGTAGALRDALPRLADTFMVLYGDTYLDVDLRSLWEAHHRSGAQGTLFLHPNDHPKDSDLVEIDPAMGVVAIHPYPHPPELECRNLVNAALYVFNKEGLAAILPADGKADLAKHSFPAMIAAGLPLRAYVSPEYIKDMGTPERLDSVARDVTSGVAELRSGRALREAIFLDRDGTINVECDHLRRPDQLELLPGVGTAVRRINKSGLLAVGITNQPVLARGELDWAGLARIHGRLDSLLGAEGAYLDAMYVCPHHPHAGYPGEVPELKRNCHCRKPGTGLIDQACRELMIGRGRSWVVGDSTSDMEAGRKAGLRTVLVRTGYRGLDGKHLSLPDYTVPGLTAAVHWILQGHPGLQTSLMPIAARTLSARLVLIGGLARTGKSSTAQVLRELYASVGRRAHIIALDGWLRPTEARTERAGVLSRYDLLGVEAFLLPLLDRSQVHRIYPPVYDPVRRRPVPLGRSLYIGAEDILIVEGVPGLLSEVLSARSDERIQVEAPEAIRRERILDDYLWRGTTPQAIEVLIESRASDETPWVQRGSDCATSLVISGGIS